MPELTDPRPAFEPRSGTVRRLTAIVTVDEREAAGEDFSRLLASGRDQVSRWIIVARGIGEQAQRAVRDAVSASGLRSDHVSIAGIGPCGPSAARNQGVREYLRLTSAGERDDDVVVFPDDDCQLPAGYAEAVGGDPALEREGFLITPYAPADGEVNRDRWPAGGGEISPREALARTAMAGCIFTGTRAAELLLFDETLGPATARSGAEDVELAQRMASQGRSLQYRGSVWMNHPYRREVQTRAVGAVAVSTAYRSTVGTVAALRGLVRAARLSLRSQGPAGALRDLAQIVSFSPLQPGAQRQSERAMPLSVGDTALVMLAALRGEGSELPLIVELAPGSLRRRTVQLNPEGRTESTAAAVISARAALAALSTGRLVPPASEGRLVEELDRVFLREHGRLPVYSHSFEAGPVDVLVLKASDPRHGALIRSAAGRGVRCIVLR